MTSDYATRLRALAETVEQSTDTHAYAYPQAARDALLTAWFAILAAEGFGVASGPTFIAFEGLEEFAAVRLEMLVGLRDDDTEEVDR
jgi:hypothetical protein